MALFSKQNKEAFIKPLNGDNPVLVQVLGICSALAVTSQLKPAGCFADKSEFHERGIPEARGCCG